MQRRMTLQLQTGITSGEGATAAANLMFSSSADMQQASYEFAQTLSSAISVFLFKLNQQQHQQLQQQYQQQHMGTWPHPQQQQHPVEHQGSFGNVQLSPIPIMHPNPSSGDDNFKCGFHQCPCSQDRSTATGAFLHMLACGHRPKHDIDFSVQVLKHISSFPRGPITGNSMCCYCGKEYSDEERSSKKRCSVGRHKRRCLIKMMQLLQDPNRQDKAAADLHRVWARIVRTNRKTENGQPTLVIDPAVKSPRKSKSAITHFEQTQVPYSSHSSSNSLEWHGRNSAEDADKFFAWSMSSSQESFLSASDMLSDD